MDRRPVSFLAVIKKDMAFLWLCLYPRRQGGREQSKRPVVWSEQRAFPGIAHTSSPFSSSLLPTSKQLPCSGVPAHQLFYKVTAGLQVTTPGLQVIAVPSPDNSVLSVCVLSTHITITNLRLSRIKALWQWARGVHSVGHTGLPIRTAQDGGGGQVGSLRLKGPGVSRWRLLRGLRVMLSWRTVTCQGPGRGQVNGKVQESDSECKSGEL